METPFARREQECLAFGWPRPPLLRDKQKIMKNHSPSSPFIRPLYALMLGAAALLLWLLAQPRPGLRIVTLDPVLARTTPRRPYPFQPAFGSPPTTSNTSRMESAMNPSGRPKRSSPMPAVPPKSFRRPIRTSSFSRKSKTDAPSNSSMPSSNTPTTTSTFRSCFTLPAKGKSSIWPCCRA